MTTTEAGLPTVGSTDGARETSGATTALLLEFVRAQAGEAAVEEVLRRAGSPFTAAELARPSHWIGYGLRIRLFAAATEVLDDPATMFRVGSEALAHGMNPGLVLLVRAIGSPRQVYRQLPRAVAKFSTTSTMQIVESGATHATIRYRLHEGYVHSRLDCDYARGLIGMVPAVFGLPPANVLHSECESDGHEACIYHLTWQNRPRRGLRRHRAALETSAELEALRSQLRSLQSAATDLVASEDLDTVLRRIVTRAAEAVLAPAYLLAVARPGGASPLVHSAGVVEAEIPGLARTLLGGGDLGQNAVVVDVASARRWHGRLAALYRPGDGALGDEHPMLAAYAGQAAAALDLLMALDEVRLEAERARALLGLAHGLAGAVDADAVCSVVARALPGIVDCTRASILLWDPADGVLRPAATEGMTPEQTDALMGALLRPEDTPELIGMLADREPLILRDLTSSPTLRVLLEAVGSTDVVAVPLLAGPAFLGIAAAGWTSGQAPADPAGDVLVRLRGVGDQASSALQKARLLETVRHQATHDALTGLPNRRLFVQRLEAALAGNVPGTELAVLFCDLNGFKAVNDTYGHGPGDELLRQVAARLGAAVRPEDTVGRLSGDEFAILLPGLASARDATALAVRVAACFDEPFRVHGRLIPMSTSVGIAVRGGADDLEALLHRADAQMYLDKERHRGEAAAP